MRALLQRVSRALITVSGETVAAMGPGLLVLLGVGRDDDERHAEWLADKVCGLRVFEDETGKMNLSLQQVAGEMIVVSQFTLFGDCRKGKRPSYARAMEPQRARQLVDHFASQVRRQGISCGQGVFGAHMRVELVNDGPVTLLLDSQVSRRRSGQAFSEPTT